MKIAPKKNWIPNATATLALSFFLLAGCVGGGSPFHSISEILGARVNEEPRPFGNEYVFYPHYDIYYNRTSGEFVSFENGRWVSRQTPRNATAQSVLQSRSVNIDGFESPAHHRYEMAQQGARYEQGRYNRQQQSFPPGYQRGINTGRY